MRFAVAIALLLGFVSIAEAGCWGWGCRVRVVRPCCPVVQPVAVVQPVTVQVPTVDVQAGQAVIYRRHYATPVRDALFGRYRVGIVPQQCGPAGCPNQPLPAPNPDPGPSIQPIPEVKVDAPGVQVEVR